MRSRAELRRVAEWVLRGALVALIAVALWRTLRPRASGTEHRSATAGTLRRTLREASTTPRIGGVSLTLDSLPSPTERAWLTALRHAGVDVSWRGELPPLALDAERVREPDARARIYLAADAGARLAAAGSRRARRTPAS